MIFLFSLVLPLRAVEPVVSEVRSVQKASSQKLSLSYNSAQLSSTFYGNLITTHTNVFIPWDFSVSVYAEGQKIENLEFG